MSGNPGDGDGRVFLAHAWVPDGLREETVGPWHWWNVYKDQATAYSQAVRASMQAGWKGLSKYEVTEVEGKRH